MEDYEKKNDLPHKMSIYSKIRSFVRSIMATQLRQTEYCGR
jgi:hypothetical protein